MDSIFLLQQQDRVAFLQAIGPVIGCTYICIWFYHPHPDNFLESLDGWYNAETDRPSSSAGSLPERLFNVYRRSIYRVQNGRVPGSAFMLGMPCLQLHESDLSTWASSVNQRLFYQEAQIKIAMFMGCRYGEVEIGSSVTANQTKMQMDETTNLFSEDFIRGFSSGEAAGSFEHGQSSFSPPSSEYISPFLGMPITTPFITDPVQPPPATPLASSSLPPHQQEMQAHAQAHNIRFPTPADDDAAMARAMLAVLSSQSTLSSSRQTQQTQTPQHQISDETGAFKPYSPALNPVIGTRTRSDGQYRMKLVFAILRSIFSTSSEPWVQEAQRRSSQLHHIMAERRRRGRMNEEFRELITLLPNVPKKERVSRVLVLNATRQYLRGLKAQVEELKEKNQALETQAAGRREEDEITDSDQTERVVVEAMEASSSQERQVEVRVRVAMEDERGLAALVLRILERLKRMNDVSLASMQADTQLHQARRRNRLILRLKIKGGTWDDKSIKEAMNDAIFNEAP